MPLFNEIARMDFHQYDCLSLFVFRFFMARKGILPRRKRGRASTTAIDMDELTHMAQIVQNQSQRQPMYYNVDKRPPSISDQK